MRCILHLTFIALISLCLGHASGQIDNGPAPANPAYLDTIYETCNTLLGNAYNMGSFVKRARKYDEMGPFWANRGKKIPLYAHAHLYAEEPRWKVKKEQQEQAKDNNRDRRTQDDMFIDATSPFFATRGKKNLMRF